MRCDKMGNQSGRFFKVGGPMTNLLENVRKRRTKILVLLAANQMNEQPLDGGNTFVPQDQDLVHWSSYLKKNACGFDGGFYCGFDGGLDGGLGGERDGGLDGGLDGCLDGGLDGGLDRLKISVLLSINNVGIEALLSALLSHY